MGAGTSCDDDGSSEDAEHDYPVWPGRREACCLPGGACVDVPDSQCTRELDGEPQGFGSTCSRCRCEDESEVEGDSEAPGTPETEQEYLKRLLGPPVLWYIVSGDDDSETSDELLRLFEEATSNGDLVYEVVELDQAADQPCYSISNLASRSTPNFVVASASAREYLEGCASMTSHEVIPDAHLIDGIQRRYVDKHRVSQIIDRVVSDGYGEKPGGEQQVGQSQFTRLTKMGGLYVGSGEIDGLDPFSTGGESLFGQLFGTDPFSSMDGVMSFDPFGIFGDDPTTGTPGTDVIDGMFGPGSIFGGFGTLSGLAKAAGVGGDLLGTMFGIEGYDSPPPSDGSDVGQDAGPSDAGPKTGPQSGNQSGQGQNNQGGNNQGGNNQGGNNQGGNNQGGNNQGGNNQGGNNQGGNSQSGGSGPLGQEPEASAADKAAACTAFAFVACALGPPPVKVGPGATLCRMAVGALCSAAISLGEASGSGSSGGSSGPSDAGSPSDAGPPPGGTESSIESGDGGNHRIKMSQWYQKVKTAEAIRDIEAGTVKPEESDTGWVNQEMWLFGKEGVTGPGGHPDDNVLLEGGIDPGWAFRDIVPPERKDLGPTCYVCDPPTHENSVAFMDVGRGALACAAGGPVPPLAIETGYLRVTEVVRSFAEAIPVEVVLDEAFDSADDVALDQWQLPAGWSLDASGYLRGRGHSSANRRGVDCGYSGALFASVFLEQGMVHLHYQNSPLGRYFVGLHAGGVYLRKEQPRGTFTLLGNAYIGIAVDEWHRVIVSQEQGRISVSVDGVILISASDPSPLSHGHIGFETLEDSVARIDDVRVVRDTPDNDQDIAQSWPSSADLPVIAEDTFDDPIAGGWDLGWGWEAQVLPDVGSVIVGTGDDRWGNFAWGHHLTYGESSALISDVMIDYGQLQITYRQEKGGCRRYFAWFNSEEMGLTKQVGCEEFVDLAYTPVGLAEDEWYNVAIISDGGHLQVAVDGQVLIDVLDPDPLPAGSIAFETWPNSRAIVDSLVVMDLDVEGTARSGVDGASLGELIFTTDFENGDLRGWTIVGAAFVNQPTRGDNTTARDREPSNHEGQWWIGGYEDYQGRPGQTPGSIQGDQWTGTLTSALFVIAGPSLSFLIGGGNHPIGDPTGGTGVALVIEGEVVFFATGEDTETMQRVEWDVSEYIGRTAVIRIIDENTGGWGHINCDDFRIPGA